MLKTISAAALLAVLALPAAASVTYDDATKSLTVSGPTTIYQVQAAYIAMSSNEVITVLLSGPGGNYYAGMALGRVIRSEGANVIVPEGAVCVSACAFAALGGERVLVDGELWFHAPYLTMVPTNVSILEVAQQFGKAYLDMSVYLSQQGVSILFANDIMKKTSTCKFIVIKDGEEITKLRSGEFPHSRTDYQYNLLDNC